MLYNIKTMKASFLNRNTIDIIKNGCVYLKSVDDNNKIISKEFCYMKELNNDLLDILSIEYHAVNYKKERDFPFYKFLTNLNIKTCYIESSTDIYANRLLLCLTRLNKGQYLLNSFKKIIIDLILVQNEDAKRNIFDDYINTASLSGTLPTFLFWMNVRTCILGKFDMDYKGPNILTLAGHNSDNRIMKWILSHLHTFKTKKSSTTEYFFRELHNSIFSKHIPEKYILRRLKLVSKHFNLVPHFNNMIIYLIITLL